MKNLKFKAWDKVNKKLFQVTSLLAFDKHGNIIAIDDSPIENFEILQYTGLKDLNGNEIYEGDIVSGKGFNDRLWIVEYSTDKEYCGFVPRENGKGISYFVSWGVMTVVGNIYENPELLSAQ